MDNLLGDFEAMKLSVLTHAAKVSPLVTKGVTIGPNSKGTTEVIGKTRRKLNKSIEKSKPVIEELTVPKEVSEDTDYENDILSIGVNDSLQHFIDDCHALSTKLKLKEQEQVARYNAKRNIANRLDVLKQEHQKKHEALKIEFQNSMHAIKKKREENIRKQMEIGQIADEEAKQNDETLRRNMEKQQRRVAENKMIIQKEGERYNNLKRIMESRKHFKGFCEKYCSLVDKIEQFPQVPEFNKRLKTLITEYEQMKPLLKSDNLEGSDANKAIQLTQNLETLVNELESYRNEQIKLIRQQNEQLAAVEAARQKELAAVPIAQNKETINVNVPKSDTVRLGDSGDKLIVPCGGNVCQFASVQCLNLYNEYINYYNQFEEMMQHFSKDTSVQQFRHSCMKAVNIPVNLMAVKSPKTLIESFSKLSNLLAGKQVEVAGNIVCANQHPLGIIYCTWLLVQRIINKSVTDKNDIEYSLAAITVALWQMFPDFGKLFLGYLYKTYHFFVPCIVLRVEGQSAEDYLKAIGYTYTNNGQMENNHSYLNKLGGIMRLYAAIQITTNRRGENSPHPHSINHGWIWLCNFVNFEPQEFICSTLILEFLQMAGNELYKVYGKQFIKLLCMIKNQYFIKLKQIDRGAGLSNLETLLTDIEQKNELPKPQGALPSNYW